MSFAVTCENCGNSFVSTSRRRTCSRSCAVTLSWKSNPEKRRASIAKARNTPEQRARTIEINNRRWGQPGERERLSERNREMWRNPRMKKKLSRAIRKSHSTPEMRAHYSRMRTEQWASDAEYRAKTIAAVRLHHSAPEARAKFSKLLAERWNDPVIRAKMTVANRKTAASEGVRARLSQSTRERWATDQVFRSTVLEAMRIYNASPEAAVVKSDRMKALWADPVWRARQLELVARNPNTPKGIRSALSVKALGETTALLAEINSVIPRELPEFMRSDIASDITVALLEGIIKIGSLKSEARSYLTAHRKMFPDKWGPISIDAPIPGTDGFTLADTFSNDTPHF